MYIHAYRYMYVAVYSPKPLHHTDVHVYVEISIFICICIRIHSCIDIYICIYIYSRRFP